MPLILRQELQMPTDIVEAMMGHTDGSILTKNYTGDVPTLVSQGLEDLASGRVDVQSPITAAPMGQQAATAVPLTSEAQQAVSEQVTAEAQQKATSARLAQIEDEKRIVQYYKSSEGQELLEAQQQLELDEIRRGEELKKEKSRLRGEAKAKEEADKRSQAVKELGDNETARARRKALRQALAKGTKTVGDKGMRLLPLAAAVPVAREAISAAEAGELGLAAKRGLQAVEEMVSPSPVTTRQIEDIEPVESPYGSRTLGETLQRGLEKTGRSISEQTSELFDRN